MHKNALNYIRFELLTLSRLTNHPIHLCLWLTRKTPGRDTHTHRRTHRNARHWRCSVSCMNPESRTDVRLSKPVMKTSIYVKLILCQQTWDDIVKMFVKCGNAVAMIYFIISKSHVLWRWDIGGKNIRKDCDAVPRKLCSRFWDEGPSIIFVCDIMKIKFKKDPRGCKTTLS